MDSNGTCSPEEIQLLIGGHDIVPGTVALDPSQTDAHTTNYVWFMYYLGLAAQVCYETMQVSNKMQGPIKAWKVPINKEVKHPY